MLIARQPVYALRLLCSDAWRLDSGCTGLRICRIILDARRNGRPGATDPLVASFRLDVSWLPFLRLLGISRELCAAVGGTMRWCTDSLHYWFAYDDTWRLNRQTSGQKTIYYWYNTDTKYFKLKFVSASLQVSLKTCNGSKKSALVPNAHC
jgi:hypothetical protein